MNSPEIFGHYTVLEELGRGGMGMVYKAFDRKLDRIVALKLINPEFKSDDTQIKRFIQEAKAIAQLQHPNIVQIYEIGETPEPYFVMEFLEGETLAKWIGKGKLDVADAIGILIKICAAVESAHKKNIIHRDLKPSNILMTKDNEPKVMDFGLAKFLDVPLRLSKPGEPIGTAFYMSPEQACGEETDKRSDIYSLGIIFYEILTGRPPFQGSSALGIVQQIIKSPPTPPSIHKASVPPEIDAICLKCLAKKPDDRYATVEKLRSELERFLSHQGETDEVKVSSRKRHHAGKLLSVAMGILLLAAGALSWLFFLAPLSTVVIEMHSSNTKQDWIDALIALFNAQKHKISDGSVISVKVVHVGSGSSMDSILQGKARPTVWSPGSGPWVEQINQAWQDRTGKKLIAASSPATTNEPLVIAMWEPMARALGWPDKPLGWQHIAALAADPKGWETYGHPQWGLFKFGHGHPDYSNSGLLSIIAEVYGAAKVQKGLTVEMVKSQPVKNHLGAIEQRVYHYGRLDTDLLLKMTQQGPSYLHAVVTYEVNVVKWNIDHAKELQFPLAVIYPAEGTFWVDNPYCVLEADWVSKQQREAAEVFGKFLLKPEQMAKAIDFALRPADPDVPLRTPIDTANGALPHITQQAVPNLEYPTKEVVGHIVDIFHRVKKKTTVLLLLDVSASMAGEKIKSATKGAVAFLDQMSPGDKIMVYAFSDKIHELQPAGTVGKVRETLRKNVQSLYAEGGTALYEVVLKALEHVDAEQKTDQSAGKSRVYAIVLLSDGKNEVEEGPTKNDLLSRLPSTEQPGNVKIYTIAYGDEADKDLLMTLARRTNGKAFTSDPATLKSIYGLIASEF